MTFSAVRMALLAKPKTIYGWILATGILITLAAAALTIYKPLLFRMLDNKVYDTTLRSGIGPSDTLATVNPVIVDIDEASLARFGQWPWPRYRVGMLLDKIRNLGASTVGLDMFFPEPDRTSLDRVQDNLLREFGYRLDLRDIPPGLKDNDAVLADVLSHGPYVLGYSFLFSATDASTDTDTPAEDDFLRPLSTVTVGAPGTAGATDGLFTATGVALNLPELSRAAAAAGFFNVTPDPDGVLRRVPLLIAYEDRIYPSLALATVMQAKGIDRVTLHNGVHGLESIALDGTAIPVDSRANLLICFHGSSRFTSIPAVDVLLDRVPRDKLEGKTVILGTSAAGLEEYRTTPLVTTLPGMAVHATIVDNILKKEFFSRPPWVPGLELVLVLLCGIVSAVLLSWTRSILGFCVILVAGVCLWVGSAWLLLNRGIYVPPLSPILTLCLNFSILTFIKYCQEEKTLKTRNQELVVMQNFTIQCLAALTETRDSETGGHILRCQHYVKILAEHLATNPRFSQTLDEATIDLLYKSAPLHDIGKVGIPDSILLKPGRLTEDEYREMKKHTLYGREAIQRAEKSYGEDVNDSFLRFGKVIAYSHHEKWDGTGYPEGLSRENIPLFARIMAIADVYDALICRRRYKPSFSHEEAVEIISRNKGTHFDPVVVEAFLEMQEEFLLIARRFPDERPESIPG